MPTRSATSSIKALRPPETASRPQATEGFVSLGDDAQPMYCIPRFDRITPPFLMTITSESDLWMYVSSAGGLTAGRIDEEHALLPYETEDKLHRAYGVTGPITLMRIWRGGNGSDV